MKISAQIFVGRYALVVSLTLVLALVLAPFGMTHGDSAVAGLGHSEFASAGHETDSLEIESKHDDLGQLSGEHHSWSKMGNVLPEGGSSHSHEQCCSSFCGSAILALTDMSRLDVFQDTDSASFAAAILPGDLTNPGRPPRA